MSNNFRTNTGRQELIVAISLPDSDSINESAAVVMFQVPGGSVITGGHLVPDGNYDATTATMSLGDANDPARYLAGTDIKTAAEIPLDTDGKAVEDDETDIIATFTIAGTPTIGGARVAIQYYELGRSCFNHGKTVESVT